ncbi:MAG: hypothetical protein FJX75_24915 [Armatimonadetes bacterium]|nr:hypothetical protein [Armatimonadota bacterium]
MKKKRFDCVELQHRGGERLMRKLEKMTIEERVEYFRQRTASQRELQRKLQAEAKEPVRAEGDG